MALNTTIQQKYINLLKKSNFVRKIKQNNNNNGQNGTKQQ